MELNSENIFKLPEGKIVLSNPPNSDYHTGDEDLKYLLDKDVKKHGYYGIKLSTNPKSWFEFEIFQKSRIYAYGDDYSDSSGSSLQTFDLYQFNGSKFEPYIQNIQTKMGWYILFDELPIGKYKLIPKASYCCFSEWFVENLIHCKYLLKQNDRYYSIKNDLLELGDFKDNEILLSWYKNYGIDDLNNLLQDNKLFKIQRQLGDKIQIASLEMIN